MKLRKGYRIKINKREGIITDFGWKNRHRTISYETDDRIPYWGYKENIQEVDINGKWIPYYLL